VTKIDNVLDTVDTLRTSSMIFKILSTSKDDTFCYSNEIFNITSYFCNKLLALRPASVQNKFLGFFKTDSTSEHFFKQCYEYIMVHIDKLSKGTLKHHYNRQKYTDELSDKCYMIDKNLEKQVVSLFMNFCLQGNFEMQEYIREQTNNTKSYNLVIAITSYANRFLSHLEYPVAYDTFHRTIECLLELIQGPNDKNQEIVIQHKFLELTNKVLEMDYKENQVFVKDIRKHYKNNYI
jgi:hypothetical protein